MAQPQGVVTMAQTPFFKYLATNSTSTSALSSDGISETRPTSLIPTRAPDGSRFRGIQLLPFGTNANDEDFHMALFTIHEVTDWGADKSKDHDFVLGLDKQWLTRRVTLLVPIQVTGNGTAGAYITDTDFTCDTITQTRTAWGTALESAFGQTSVIFTGAQFASYYLPDFGDADYLTVEFDINAGGSASASANTLIKLFR